MRLYPHKEKKKHISTGIWTEHFWPPKKNLELKNIRWKKNFEAIKPFRAAGVEAALVWGNRQHVAQTSQLRLPWEQMNSICYGKRLSRYKLGANLCFT